MPTAGYYVIIKHSACANKLHCQLAVISKWVLLQKCNLLYPIFGNNFIWKYINLHTGKLAGIQQLACLGIIGVMLLV